MAMKIMNKYISRNKVENAEFQLVGISSYLLSSKYEFIYPLMLMNFPKYAILFILLMISSKKNMKFYLDMISIFSITLLINF